MSELPSIHSRSMVSWGLAVVLRSRIAALLHRAADHLAGLSSLAPVRLHPPSLSQSPTYSHLWQCAKWNACHVHTAQSRLFW